MVAKGWGVFGDSLSVIVAEFLLIFTSRFFKRGGNGGGGGPGGEILSSSFVVSSSSLDLTCISKLSTDLKLKKNSSSIYFYN